MWSLHEANAEGAIFRTTVFDESDLDAARAALTHDAALVTFCRVRARKRHDAEGGRPSAMSGTDGAQARIHRLVGVYNADGTLRVN